jgi:catechol 2,3-dioxygenase-like lactoylglutathione lyase family enzyme
MIVLLTNIDVPDLEAAIAFYRDALGFRLARRLFDGTVAEIVDGSSTLYLLRKPAGSAPSATAPAARDYRRHWTPVHFDVVVADLDAAVRRARDAGAILEGAVGAHPWGKLATLADPFGHGFCLVEFAPGGYDNVA